MEQQQTQTNPLSAIVAAPIVSKPLADSLLEHMRLIPAVIEDHATNAEVGALIKKLRDLAKGIEESRKAIASPINAGLKLLKANYDGITGPLAAAQADLSRRQTVFMREEERKRSEAEAAARKEQEEEALAQAVKVEELGEPEYADQVLENAQVLPPPIMPPVQQARAESGTLTTMRDNWVWEQEGGLRAVDPAFLMVNSAEVTKAVKGGARQINGIRIWNDRKAVAR